MQQNLESYQKGTINSQVSAHSRLVLRHLGLTLQLATFAFTFALAFWSLSLLAIHHLSP